MNKYDLQRQGKLRSLGLCFRCGKLPERDGNLFCVSCLVFRAESQRKKRAERRESKKCIDCGDLPLDGNGRCKVCYAKMVSKSVFNEAARWTDLIALFEKQHGIFPYTGRQLVLGIDADLDHIIPKSRQGSNELNNLQWVHRDVNRMKGNHSEDNFLALIKEIFTHKAL